MMVSQLVMSVARASDAPSLGAVGHFFQGGLAALSMCGLSSVFALFLSSCKTLCVTLPF